MKILFVETFVDFPRLKGVYFPNPGPLAVATYLKKYGYEVKIIDAPALGLKPAELVRIIRKENPDILGLSGVTKNSYMCMALGETVKEIKPSIITIFGGIHFSLNPEESLRICKGIDYIVIGEGELTSLELIKSVEKGNHKKEKLKEIKGIAYLLGDRYIQTKPRPYIEDLDILPIPEYGLLPMEKYNIPYLGKRGFGCSFSRGCPHLCVFCSESALWKNTWRGRSAKKMVEEIEALVKEFKKDSFWFGDPNFLFNRERNMEFISELEKRNLDINFQIEATVKSLIRNNDILSRLKKNGLKVVMVGIETYSEEKLKRLNKNQVLAEIRIMARHVYESKIPILMACLIWGDYEDDKTAIFKLLRETNKIKGDFLAHNLLTPWPGTKLFNEMKQRGRIAIWDYRRYDFDHAIMPTKYLSILKLEIFTLMAFFLWWFNAYRIFKNMLNNTRRSLQLYQFKVALTIFQVLLTKLIRKKYVEEFDLKVKDVYRRHLAHLRVVEKKDVYRFRGFPWYK